MVALVLTNNIVRYQDESIEQSSSSKRKQTRAFGEKMDMSACHVTAPDRLAAAMDCPRSLLSLFDHQPVLLSVILLPLRLDL